MTKMLPKGVDKGHLITDKEKKVLNNLRAEYNKERNCDVGSKEFLEHHILKSLSRFKEGNLERTKSKTPSSKASKGVSGLSNRDEQTAKRVLSLQKNSICRAAVACLYETMRALDIVKQKFQSVIDILDDINAINKDNPDSRILDDSIIRSESKASQQSSSAKMHEEADDMSFLLGDEDCEASTSPLRRGNSDITRVSLLEACFQPVEHISTLEPPTQAKSRDNEAAASSSREPVNSKEAQTSTATELELVDESNSISKDELLQKTDSIVSAFVRVFDESGKKT